MRLYSVRLHDLAADQEVRLRVSSKVCGVPYTKSCIRQHSTPAAQPNEYTLQDKHEQCTHMWFQDALQHNECLIPRIPSYFSDMIGDRARATTIAANRHSGKAEGGRISGPRALDNPQRLWSQAEGLVCFDGVLVEEFWDRRRLVRVVGGRFVL